MLVDNTDQDCSWSKSASSHGRAAMHFVAIAAFLVWLGSFLYASGFLDSRVFFAPRLNVSSEVHDFGPTSLGKSLEYTFVLSNSGNRDLVIEDVVSDCSCLVVDHASKHIGPGESFPLKIQLVPSSSRGPFRRKLTVLTNDPVARRRVLILQGTARRDSEARSEDAE